MPVDAGDLKYERGTTVTLTTGSNDVSKGDAVTFDGSDDVQTCSANDDDLVGVVNEVEDDDHATVILPGPVARVTADGAVGAGDTLVPSGSVGGAFTSHAGGMYNPNPDTGADAVAANHPYALESANDGEVFLACFR